MANTQMPNKANLQNADQRYNALQQAEMMEKEKAILELQNKVQGMKQSYQSMAGTQVALERERKRCQITQAELTPLADDHKVYKNVGRCFIAAKKPALLTESKKREEMCEGEAARLGDEKGKLVVHIQSEEKHLEESANEFMAQVQLLQAMAQRSQQESASGNAKKK